MWVYSRMMQWHIHTGWWSLVNCMVWSTYEVDLLYKRHMTINEMANGPWGRHQPLWWSVYQQDGVPRQEVLSFNVYKIKIYLKMYLPPTLFIFNWTSICFLGEGVELTLRIKKVNCLTWNYLVGSRKGTWRWGACAAQSL